MVQDMLEILILTNGPGEVTTWVWPVVRAIKQTIAETRVSVVLSPCPNATGREVQILENWPEVDRTQGAEFFWDFLLWGKTQQNWEWGPKGVVIFLGGDQFYPVVISKRLGYKSLIYAEWDARWPGLIDLFALMRPEVKDKLSQRHWAKCHVVGDLMADVPSDQVAVEEEIVGLMPGSKAAKLSQGVPLALAVAEYIHARRPQTSFLLPVAPTLDVEYLAGFADRTINPIIDQLGGVSAHLQRRGNQPYLVTSGGLEITLVTEFPAHRLLRRCCLCLTTVGANTAELGSLAIPMIVLLPTQQLDAMRSWDGIPGILARLPGVGSGFAKLINWLVLRRGRLFAWPNIWAKAEIVPELVGNLQPEQIGQLALEYLANPETLAQMSDRLRQVRGEPGAAARIVGLVQHLASTYEP